MLYRPIDQQTHPGLVDRLVYSIKESFEVLPQLSSTLSRFTEKVVAISSYYNHNNPSLSAAAEVYYNIDRTITTASARPILLRHNGDTVDMELFVDNYTLSQKKPVLGQYPLVDVKTVQQQTNDKYVKTSMQFIYKGIVVPPVSGRVWDGRHAQAVDLQGQVIVSTDRISVLRAQVEEILTNPTLIPYDIVYLSSGGAGVTSNIPNETIYQDRYRLELREFIEKNYSADGIPDRPKGSADIDLVIGEGEFIQSTVVAVLEDIYFSHWANLVMLG